MSKKVRSRLLKYGISTAVCLVIAGIYIACYDRTGSAKDWFLCLSNAFFLPGVLMVFAGLLVFVSNEGAFDGVGYILHAVVRAILPGGRNTMVSYKDYREQHQQKKTTGFGFMILVGAAFVLLGALFSLLYFNC